MTVVPITSLSPCEIAMLGNNVKSPVRRRRPRPKYSRLAAVNRSLKAIGESVRTLHRALALAS